MAMCEDSYVTCMIPAIRPKTRPFLRGFSSLVFFASACGFAQPAPSGDPPVSVGPAPVGAPAVESKRIFGIIPNNRTWPSLKNYVPLTAKEKFEIARQDSFDRGTVVLAAAFAADAQLTKASPSFGQGVTGIRPLLRGVVWRLRDRQLHV